MAVQQIKLDFTGERMIPENNSGAAFYYEHLVRYLFASSFVKGKRVLDAGSGSGYGSYLLVQRGKPREIIGVDLSEEAVEYASATYHHPKLQYRVNNVEKLSGLEDESFDVVVSFEVIEHLNDIDAYLHAIRRVLKKDGIFIVSTPNKNTYPDGNDYHTTEFYPEEFRDLLKNKFKHIEFLHQNFEFAQVLKTLSSTEEQVDKLHLAEDDQADTFVPIPNNHNSQYLVAVCSNKELPKLNTHVLTTQHVDFFDMSQGILTLSEQFSEAFNGGGGKSKFPAVYEKLEEALLQYNALDQELKHIRQSKFYCVWQTYVKFKRILGISRLTDSSLPGNTISQFENRVLTPQQRLEYLQFQIKQKKYDLRQIRSARAYRFWQKLLVTKWDVSQTVKTKVKQLIPINTRKRIKFLYSYFFRSHTITAEVFIPGSIKTEWAEWAQKRKNDSLDIFIFGVIGYKYRHQRPQHLAEELVKKGHRVFYIENSFSIASLKIEKLKKNLYILTLPAYMSYFIYQDTAQDADLKLWLQTFKNLFREATVINPVGKIDHPFWYDLIEKLELQYFYDCMDKHSGFSENSPNILNREEKIIRSALFNIATSKVLLKDIEAIQKNSTILLPNAGSYTHFSQAASRSTAQKKDFKIIGYFGAIADWFDAELLEKVLKKYPNHKVHLIGLVNNQQISKLAKKYSNLILFGEVPYQDLPMYLKEFDVCLIPFIVNDLIKATSPVKVYEYLAAGKPVVTTALPEIKDLEGVVHYARSHKAFLEGIEATLTEKETAKIIATRQDVAKQNTWDKRGIVLLDTIKEKYFPKVSVIVLSYNNQSMLHDCLQSVKDRSFYPNVELIVVDNNSNKETKEYLKKLNKNSDVKVIFNDTNEGFAAGNNIGLAAASGDYLILLNNDTLVTPGWIERLVYHVSSDPKVALVGPVTNSIGNEAKVDIGPYDPHKQEELETAARNYVCEHWGESLDLRNLAAFCWIMPKHIYEKYGGFDERYGKAMFEDDDYCTLLRHEGYHFLCIDDAYIHHFGSQSLSKLQSEEYKALFAENKQKYEEKWDEAWVPHKYRE